MSQRAGEQNLTFFSKLYLAALLTTDKILFSQSSRLTRESPLPKTQERILLLSNRAVRAYD